MHRALIFDGLFTFELIHSCMKYNHGVTNGGTLAGRALSDRTERPGRTYGMAP